MGRGIGYVEIHLLASARLSHCRLWTQDGRLAAVAQEQGLRNVNLNLEAILQTIVEGACWAI